MIRLLSTLITLMLFSILMTACQKEDTTISNNDDDEIIIQEDTTGLCGHLLLTTDNGGILDDGDGSWLIADNQVRDGGPGKDGIPSVDIPEFSSVDDINFLNNGDYVLGVKVGSEIRAYPHPVLDWHEIVNDEFLGQADCKTYLSINYCPLTGTGMAWNRELDGKITTFGVSGLLYNTNLIPYDRNTDSNWSQMRLDCVQGSLQGQKITTYPLIETTWKTWKERYPNSKVMNSETGFNRSYGSYPYGDYRTSENLVFPVNISDRRLPRKERVLGVIADGIAKVYRFNSFTEIAGEATELIEDSVNGQAIVVIGNNDANFLVAYQRTTMDGTLLEFQAMQDSPDSIMKDNEGNSWNLFGEAIAGPRTGERLSPTRSYMGYFFSWGAFYPNVEIY